MPLEEWQAAWPVEQQREWNRRAWAVLASFGVERPGESVVSTRERPSEVPLYETWGMDAWGPERRARAVAKSAEANRRPRAVPNCERCGADMAHVRAKNKRFCGDVCRREWWNEAKRNGYWNEQRNADTRERYARQKAGLHPCRNPFCGGPRRANDGARCNPCANYWKRTGQERPSELVARGRERTWSAA